MSYTRLGATASTGKPEVYPVGPYRAVTDRLDVTGYDSAGDGTGEALDLSREFGVHRLVECRVQVDDGGSYEAQYDATNGSIRVFNLSDGTEVAAGTDVGVLRVTVVGTGSY